MSIIEKIKAKILTLKIKDLYNTIDKDDILRKEGSVYMYQGKSLNEQEMRLLISQAQILIDSKLWKVLKKEIQYRANEAMFNKAKSEADITAGKLWLYTLDCMETRLKELSKIK